MWGLENPEEDAREGQGRAESCKQGGKIAPVTGPGVGWERGQGSRELNARPGGRSERKRRAGEVGRKGFNWAISEWASNDVRWSAKRGN